MNIASCIVDLPNIDLIATGSYKNRIELWVLRTQNNTPQLSDTEEEAKKDSKKDSSKDKSGKNSKKVEKGKSSKSVDKKGKAVKKVKEPEDDISRLKKKTLEGHKKAIREIAYSESYKILVSVGFDF
jgi:WD40 repeat protein